MPIENNEVDAFSREIGFNPYEHAVVQSYEIDGRIFTSSDVMHRIGTDLNIASFAEVTKKPKLTQSKQKPIAKLLDEVSEANKDVFDSLNKVQEEINTLEKTRLIELAEKYDEILFIIIGKSYTLVGASEKTKSSFINTLSQQLFNVINGVINNHEVSIIDFKDRMFRHVSRFLILDNVINGKFDALFEELYEYYNTVNAKKKEKRALMGREEKKKTVCEDYLYGSPTSASIRISTGNGW